MNVCLIEAVWHCGLQILNGRGPRIIELSQNHLTRSRGENRGDLVQRLIAHRAEDHCDWLMNELLEIVAEGSRRRRIVRAIEKNRRITIKYFKPPRMSGVLKPAED